MGAVERLLGEVFLPSLTRTTKWGYLSGPEGQAIKMNFLRKLAAYVSVLSNARASIDDAIKLSPIKKEELKGVNSSSDIFKCASNPELVEAAEACTQTWCKEIEQIITMSEQMRKESDDVGPHIELEYWKKRMAKFDSLTASLRNPQCRAIINILVAAKSKIIKVR